MDDFRRPVKQEKEEIEPASVRDIESHNISSDQPFYATPVPSTKVTKYRVTRLIIWGLITLTIAGLVIAVYSQWAIARDAKNELSVARAQVDAAVLANKKEAASVEPPEHEDEEAPEVSDDLLVEAEATRFVIARGGVLGSAKDRVFVVNKLESPFSSVTVTAKSAGGGFDLLLKKAEEEWVVIWSGNAQPTAAEKKQYGVPANFYSNG